jgi:hypothetical protein
MPRDWLQLPATCHHKNPKLMELADEFLELQPKYEPKIFYVWGHSYEFANNDNWYIIEDFTDKMANKDDIWYATNIEIFEYAEAYKQLKFSCKGDRVFNPTCFELFFRDSRAGKSYSVKPGETISLD